MIFRGSGKRERETEHGNERERERENESFLCHSSLSGPLVNGIPSFLCWPRDLQEREKNLGLPYVVAEEREKHDTA